MPASADEQSGVDASLDKAASWSPPKAAAVRTGVFAWLAEVKADEATRKEAQKLWPADAPPPSGAELLERVADVYALADPAARALVSLCNEPPPKGLPKTDWLGNKKTHPQVSNNLRLLYARWLAGYRLYDECAEQLAGLEPSDVVDPASLLFYRGVAHHRLLNVDAGLASINRLLERESQLPRRYASLAALMKADLEDVKEDSLDHIARRMDDIGRRLALGRAGVRVRTIEDGVIESLDKLIKKMEDAERDESSAQSNRWARNPAQESRPLGGKGAGKVDKKDIGHSGDWRVLTPKRREEVLQQIGKQFPSHYRAVIEEYFRQIAGRR